MRLLATSCRGRHAVLPCELPAGCTVLGDSRWDRDCPQQRRSLGPMPGGGQRAPASPQLRTAGAAHGLSIY